MTRTITALYDTQQEAEQAKQQLIAGGFSASDINLSHEGGGSSASGGTVSGGRGFFAGLKDMFMPDEDQHAYSEGIDRGHVLLTLRAPDGQEDRAIELLDTSGAIDFDARQQEWRASGWQGASSQQQQFGSTTQSLGADQDETIPIAEERLAVGKREVDRGSVRVRSYVTKQPVHEQVSLREEHVDIERRPVNQRMAGAGDGIFEERSFEVSERGEEAVVGKETVVTEELHVHKDVDQRTEEINDTVRRTEVDIDDERRSGIDADRDRPSRGF